MCIVVVVCTSAYNWEKSQTLHGEYMYIFFSVLKFNPQLRLNVPLKDDKKTWWNDPKTRKAGGF